LRSDLIRALMVRAGAEQRGHFVLTSGRHSGFYMDKDALSVHPQIMHLLCSELAERFEALPVEVVVGPAYGAIVAAHVVASEMSARRNYEVRSVFGLKNEQEQFEIRKSMVRHVKGARCLIIEDILTTGGSARKIIQATLEAGAAEVVGLGAFCNRGGITREDLGLPEGQFEALLTFEGIPTYIPGECPLCEQGVPISKEFGHGKTSVT
jgi:orotate phosphoribosyltransferase